MNNKRKRTSVLISGGGTNLQSLIDACESKDYPAEIVKVISNREDAFGLERAKRAGIETEVINHKNFDSRESFDSALHDAFLKVGTQLVCNAGFMRILTPGFVEKWRDKMLNIHPSLLPSFPGLHTHARALKEGVRFTGCTVHIVRAELDNGPIIIQAAVPVALGDTVEALAARVLKAEHQIYPQALKWIASGRAKIENEKVVFEDDGRAPSSLIWPNLDN